MFSHWEFINNIPLPSDTEPEITVALESSDTVIAYFVEDALPTYNFSLEVNPPGAGDVLVNTVTPASYPYTETFLSGTLVDMKAIAAADYTFDYWELDNHVVNPDPFTTDVYFALTTLENVMAHFRVGTNIDTQVDGIAAFNVVPSLTHGNINVLFDMNAGGEVTVELYSVTGVRMAMLSGGYQGVGAHTQSFNLDAFNLSSGMYFVRIMANGKAYNQQIMYTN